MDQQQNILRSLKLKGKAPPQDEVSTFIRKTYNILEENRFPNIVDWNEEGTSLVIYRPKEFCSKVLPVYFKHNQLTSFVRQLNLYDFHKRRTPTTDHVYSHELFQRGKNHLLKDIKRKNQDQTLLTLQKALETNNKSGENSQSLPGLTYENKILLTMHKEAFTRISSLDNRVKDLTIQNQALWNQINQQEKRESILKELVNAIVIEHNIPVDQLSSFLKNQSLLSGTSSPRTDHSPDRSLGLKQNSVQNCSTCIDISCFLDFEEGSDSTESNSFSCSQSLNPEDALSQITKKFNNPSDDLCLVSKFLNKADEAAKEKVKAQGQGCDDKINFRKNQDNFNWSLESEYLKSVVNINTRAQDFFPDNSCRDILGKRGFETYQNTASFNQNAFNYEAGSDPTELLGLPTKVINRG